MAECHAPTYRYSTVGFGITRRIADLFQLGTKTFRGQRLTSLNYGESFIKR